MSPRISTFLRSAHLLLKAVLTIECIDTSASSRSLLLASIVWMTLGADFYVNLRLGGTGNELITAVASNLSLIVLGLNILLHDFHLSIIFDMGGAAALPLMPTLINSENYYNKSSLKIQVDIRSFLRISESILLCILLRSMLLVLTASWSSPWPRIPYWIWCG